MTTQAITGVVWGGEGGRSYSVTATDGTFNNQMSTVTGSAQLGFGQTGQLITHVLIEYTAGGSCWRIKNRVTQQIQRVGLGFKTGTIPAQAGAIAPYVIAQDDVLEIFSQAVPT
jgi:hypothetical protein